jgi:multiple sugar transport system substrate-binding protein
MKTALVGARRRLLAAAAVVVIAFSGCAGPAATTAPAGPGGTGPAASPGGGDAGRIVMISSQLVPVEEGEKVRNEILADFEGEVEFIGAEAGPFNDQIRAQEQAGSGDISVVGGLHGEFSAFAADGFLADLSDIDVAGLNEEYVELGKLGGDQQLFVPWMQATYIMAARREALDHLPEGADINALTWDQITEWGANIQEATGERALGFPAGEDGLWHRFFQGYGYPAFTGGVNTTFASPEAIEFWTWLTETWQYVNPQATTYGFMQEPLQSGEVWVAWDHTARLIDALRNMPDEIVAFPAPAGPEGRAFMPVLAGLGVLNSAANPDGGKALIRHFIEPETQATTLAQVAFFPVVTEEIAAELDPGTQAQQEAVAAMTTADDALPALLPVGLGDQGGAYNTVFRDAFQQIVIDGGDPAAVLEEQKANLQAVLDSQEAACWPPDPPSDGTCQVE